MMSLVQSPQKIYLLSIRNLFLDFFFYHFNYHEQLCGPSSGQSQSQWQQWSRSEASPREGLRGNNCHGYKCKQHQYCWMLELWKDYGQFTICSEQIFYFFSVNQWTYCMRIMKSPWMMQRRPLLIWGVSPWRYLITHSKAIMPKK